MDTPRLPAIVKTEHEAREQLDAQVRAIVRHHFSEDTGTPFWLEKAKSYHFNPLKDVQGYADMHLFGHFEDDWLRGGPLQRWIPRALRGQPIFVFETGGTTGIPKSRIGSDDFRIDYEMMSRTLPDEFFPRGSNWLMLGPSGPRRLRLAIEHLCQHRGGICFCVDLDPRWVVKCLKRGKPDEANAYKEHCIEQALTILSAGHDIKCMFTTPKLLEAFALGLEKKGQSIKSVGIHGIFSGGTEFTPEFTRFACEELLDNGSVYMTPTYGNTLMGLACSKPVGPADGYKISYYAPQPRAVIQVQDFKDFGKTVAYGQDGRVMLTTLTYEFFVPRFMERDEGMREPPCPQYPWDGVSGVKPYREIAAATTVGVY